jgi:Ca-activated chloride channel family protein
MRSKIIQLALLAILFLVVLPFMILAGITGKIKGTVTDKETGAPIAGVAVTVVGTDIGAMTASNGLFEITNIEPGTCRLKFTAIGYKTAEIAAVSINANMVTEVNIQMEKESTDLGKVIKVTVEKDKIDKYEVSNKVQVLYNLAPSPYIRIDRAAEQSNYHPPSHGGTAIVNGEPYDAMFFKDYGTNPFIDADDDHLSTFAIDVDDASFVMTRSFLEGGNLPPDEAVRTEEFINHFRYNYASSGNEAFSVHIEGTPSKFGQNCELLRIGIQGRKIESENRKPANLVFVIDVSGSMDIENRLGLVKKALRILVDNLKPEDEVGIVVYGSHGRVVLEPTSLTHRDDILSAIEWLHADGSTNAEEGLKLGYQMAERNFDNRKINRLILCSDGVANVGVTKAEDLLAWIKGYAEKGITLTTVGFGMENYNDILMEKLGNKGNGHYAYVDDIAEARKIFLENLTGTLQVIAKDVKIQVDFDTSTVRSYRLLGYENRDVADNKFRDDKEDGGEIGSGHQVTALYEVKFREYSNSSHVATVFVRYKNPDNDEVDEVSYSVSKRNFFSRFEDGGDDFKLAAAAAEFAEILGKSYWAKGSKLTNVYDLAKEIFNKKDSPEFVEFMDLITKAQKLEDQLAEK